MVYNYFGLNLMEVFLLARILITVPIIFLTLRIPFKRTYHWMFLATSLAWLYYSSVLLYAQTVPDVADYVPISHWLYFVSNRGQTLLVFLFVAFYVSPKLKTWMKAVTVVSVAYIAITNWIPMFVDVSFIQGNPVVTATGYVAATGTSDAYLKPGTFDIYNTVMLIPIFYLLYRYYRSQSSPLVRGQIKYLVLGITIFAISGYATAIARSTGGPNLGQLIAAPGDLVLLLGLLKKGFYSVTPRSEEAKTSAPPKYHLEDAHSYLVNDPKIAFEAFSELVRSGRQGLLITRTFPDNVRKEYDIQTTPIRWLAEEKGHDAIPPGDLLGLSLTVKDFLTKATKPVVMLHGIEYLVAYNGFNPIYRLINGLGESNSANQGILVLPVIPKSLDEKEEALLGGETTPLPLPPADWEGKTA